MTTYRDQILDALSAFAEQRPGIETENYGSYASYRKESRSITRDLHHARTLLAAVRCRQSIGVDQLRTIMRRHFGASIASRYFN